MNDKDKLGWSPLIFAIREGNVDMVRALIELGAVIDPSTQGLIHNLVQSNKNYFFELPDQSEIWRLLVSAGLY